MTSIFTRGMQSINAQLFKSTVGGTSEPYIFLTFGRVRPWTDENNPTPPSTNVAQYYALWKSMVGAKQVQGNDARLAVKRVNWTYNTVYAAYDDQMDTILYGTNAANSFYVMTDAYNVYKCLSNANNSPSTIKPTSTVTSSAIQTSDNYVWKFMYTLTDEERLRFLTDNYMPVKSITESDGSLQWQVQSSAVPGAIEAIKIINAGSGFNANNPPTITITGDGSYATAIATVNSISNAISSIAITNKGIGYTNATISVVGGGGTGAVLRPIYSPPGGHGSSPVDELGASAVILNVRLRGTENGILDVDNDYRQVALIKNPKIKSKSNLATGLAYSQATGVYVTSGDTTSNYQLDEFVYQGSSLDTAVFKGMVVSWNASTGKLLLNDVVGTPGTGAVIGATSRTARSLSGNNAIIQPDLEPYSGTVLYIDNMTAIQRASDQTEEYKIVLTF